MHSGASTGTALVGCCLFAPANQWTTYKPHNERRSQNAGAQWPAGRPAGKVLRSRVPVSKSLRYHQAHAKARSPSQPARSAAWAVKASTAFVQVQRNQPLGRRQRSASFTSRPGPMPTSSTSCRHRVGPTASSGAAPSNVRLPRGVPDWQRRCSKLFLSAGRVPGWQCCGRQEHWSGYGGAVCECAARCPG